MVKSNHKVEIHVEIIEIWPEHSVNANNFQAPVVAFEKFSMQKQLKGLAQLMIHYDLVFSTSRLHLLFGAAIWPSGVW